MSSSILGSTKQETDSVDIIDVNKVACVVFVEVDATLEIDETNKKDVVFQSLSLIESYDWVSHEVEST